MYDKKDELIGLIFSSAFPPRYKRSDIFHYCLCFADLVQNLQPESWSFGKQIKRKKNELRSCPLFDASQNTAELINPIKNTEFLQNTSVSVQGNLDLDGNRLVWGTGGISQWQDWSQSMQAVEDHGCLLQSSLVLATAAGGS